MSDINKFQLPEPAFQQVNVYDYTWPTGNLARDTEVERERHALYQTDFLANAWAGIAPSIHTPVQATMPDDQGSVASILDGVGRISSLIRWYTAAGNTPEEQAESRFQDALRLYGSDLMVPGKEGGKPVKLSPKEREKITLASIDKTPAFSMSQRGVDPLAVRAAFQSEPILPVLWYDVPADVANIAAKAALFAREGATALDKLKAYRDPDVREIYPSASAFAAYVGVSAPMVTYLAKVSQAIDAGAIHPDVERIMRVHGTPMDSGDVTDLSGKTKAKTVAHNSPFTLSGLLSILKLGDDKAKHLEKGYRVEYSPTEQANALQVAYNVAWEEAKGKGAPPQVSELDEKGQYKKKVVVPDSTLRKVTFKAFQDALASGRKAENQAADGDNAPTLEEVQAGAPRDRSVRPSLRDILYFVEESRWKGTKAEEFMNAMRGYVYGFTGPKDAAAAINGATVAKGRVQRDAESMKLPTAIAAKLETFDEPAPKPEKASKAEKGESAPKKRGRPKKADKATAETEA